MIIRNKDRLATTQFRKYALEIIEAGIESVMPTRLMQSKIVFNRRTKNLQVESKNYNMSAGRIFVAGGGKAADRMAQALENIIGYKAITAGIVNCKRTVVPTRKIKVIEAGHPIPDKRGVDGVKQMLALKERNAINKDDHILCLISGGGSALLPCPAPGISLEDKRDMTGLLLKCGANIYEINTVRKHLSNIKGGRLGKFYSPAKIVSLVISDVVGDDLNIIASAPTFPDSSTFQDAYAVIKKYDLLMKAPEKIVLYLEKGCEGLIEETPKSLTNCDNYIIGNNQLALEAMADKARELGFDPVIITSRQTGNTSEVALARAAEILQGKYGSHTAIILGGETTPVLPENAGRGGRNQHYAAVSMTAMKKYPGKWLVASVGTDGSDYLPDVAGAMVAEDSIDMAVSKGINVQPYIDRFDSNTLFQKLGNSLIETGSTGTNVSDIMLYLLER
jgi:glycerate 2-kinase